MEKMRHRGNTLRHAIGMACAPLFVVLALIVPQPANASSQLGSDASEMKDNTSSAKPYEGYLRVIHSLTREGYSIAVVERTMLNRIRIMSKKGSTVRETIVSSSTGVILRDDMWKK
jgi:hypothetical protein